MVIIKNNNNYLLEALHFLMSLSRILHATIRNQFDSAEYCAVLKDNKLKTKETSENVPVEFTNGDSETWMAFPVERTSQQLQSSQKGKFAKKVSEDKQNNYDDREDDIKSNLLKKHLQILKRAVQRTSDIFYKT